MKTSPIFFWFSLMTIHHREGELSFSQQSNAKQSYYLNNDFEDGEVAPWMDLSEGRTYWALKSMTVGPWENAMSTNPTPTLPTENHVLFIEFDSETFDIGILSTTDLIASPGDTIQFSYCIYSQYNQFQTIEVIKKDLRLWFLMNLRQWDGYGVLYLCTSYSGLLLINEQKSI